MTRREGIIKAYEKLKEYEKQTNRFNIAPMEYLLETEYNNYTELCSFCSEQPKPMDIWLSETINPVKS